MLLCDNFIQGDKKAGACRPVAFGVTLDENLRSCCLCLLLCQNIKFSLDTLHSLALVHVLFASTLTFIKSKRLPDVAFNEAQDELSVLPFFCKRPCLPTRM